MSPGFIKGIAALTWVLLHADARADGVPRPPSLLSLERGHHADLVLGLGLLDDGTSYEYAVEAEAEVARGLLLGAVVPAGTVRQDGAPSGQYDSDGIPLCLDSQREASACGPGESTDTLLGNVGVSVRKVWFADGRGPSWEFGAGLTLWLPTATEPSSGDRPRFPLFDFEPAARASRLGDANHPRDPGRFRTSGTTIRPSLAAGISDVLLFEAEIGADLAINGASEQQGSVDTMRGGIALGAGTPALAAYGELGLVVPMIGEGWLTTLAVGLRTRGRWFADVALNLPIDDDLRASVDLGIRLTAGARF